MVGGYIGFFGWIFALWTNMMGYFGKKD